MSFSGDAIKAADYMLPANTSSLPSRRYGEYIRGHVASHTLSCVAGGGNVKPFDISSLRIIDYSGVNAVHTATGSQAYTNFHNIGMSFTTDYGGPAIDLTKAGTDHWVLSWFFYLDQYGAIGNSSNNATIIALTNGSDRLVFEINSSGRLYCYYSPRGSTNTGKTLLTRHTYGVVVAGQGTTVYFYLYDCNNPYPDEYTCIYYTNYTMNSAIKYAGIHWAQATSMGSYYPGHAARAVFQSVALYGNVNLTDRNDALECLRLRPIYWKNRTDIILVSTAIVRGQEGDTFYFRSCLPSDADSIKDLCLYMAYSKPSKIHTTTYDIRIRKKSDSVVFFCTRNTPINFLLSYNNGKNPAHFSMDDSEDNNAYSSGITSNYFYDTINLCYSILRDPRTYNNNSILVGTTAPNKIYCGNTEVQKIIVNGQHTVYWKNYTLKITPDASSNVLTIKRDGDSTILYCFPNDTSYTYTNVTLGALYGEKWTVNVLNGGSNARTFTVSKDMTIKWIDNIS